MNREEKSDTIFGNLLWLIKVGYAQSMTHSQFCDCVRCRLNDGPFALCLSLCASSFVCSRLYETPRGKGEGVNMWFVLPALNHFVWCIFPGETAESRPQRIRNAGRSHESDGEKMFSSVLPRVSEQLQIWILSHMDWQRESRPRDIFLVSVWRRGNWCNG